MKEFKIKLKDDSFIHFTYSKRADEIIESGKLKTNPPYKGFGIEGVQAISVNHGVLVPGVQYERILKNEDEENNRVVAILFKTTTPTKYGMGYPEEVIWDQDVKLIDPIIISKERAFEMLKSRSDNDYRIIYENRHLRDII